MLYEVKIYDKNMGLKETIPPSQLRKRHWRRFEAREEQHKDMTLDEWLEASKQERKGKDRVITPKSLDWYEYIRHGHNKGYLK